MVETDSLINDAIIHLDQDEVRKLQGELSEILDTELSANASFKNLGRSGLLNTVEAVSPINYLNLTRASENLENTGFVILDNTNVAEVDDELAQLTTVALSSVWGEPTRTDKQNDQIAWPIRYDQSAKGLTTFSQQMGEAAFHTDTQYFAFPEKFFGLYCVHSDIPGKGTNQLLSASRVIESISQQDETIIDTLKMDYPFRVPTVFTETAKEDEVEITYAPIIDNEGRIRYRYDTLLAALAIPNVVISDAQRQALDTVEEHIYKLDPTEYHLKPNQAIIVNNHRMLHARTSFDDPDRLLYRVRMTDE